MIKLSFSILNPKSLDKFEHIYQRSGAITKNKSWEFEVYKQDQTFLDIDIDTCIIGRDHAGIGIVLGLLSYVFYAKIYDNRHWDYTNNKWKEHDDKNTNC